MLLVFGYLAYKQTMAIATIFLHRTEIPMWQLTLASLIFGALFLFMILCFTVTRLPPAGWSPELRLSSARSS